MDNSEYTLFMHFFGIPLYIKKGDLNQGRRTSMDRDIVRAIPPLDSDDEHRLLTPNRRGK